MRCLHWRLAVAPFVQQTHRSGTIEMSRWPPVAKARFGENREMLLVNAPLAQIASMIRSLKRSPFILLRAMQRIDAILSSVEKSRPTRRPLLVFAGVAALVPGLADAQSS